MKIIIIIIIKKKKSRADVAFLNPYSMRAESVLITINDDSQLFKELPMHNL